MGMLLRRHQAYNDVAKVEPEEPVEVAEVTVADEEPQDKDNDTE